MRSFLVPAGVVFLCGVVAAGESVRLVVLKVPAKQAEQVRLGMNHPERAVKAETLDFVVKKLGVTPLADFSQDNPWSGVPIDMKKPMGGIIVDGESAQDLGVSLRFQGNKTETGTNELLATEVYLPLKEMGYHRYQTLEGTTIIPASRWMERSCWANSEETLMLWEFITRDAEVPKDALPHTPGLRLEFKFYDTVPSDLDVVDQAKPEEKEKALQWLSGKAKLRREAVFHARQAQGAVWCDASGVIQQKGKKVTGEETSLNIELAPLARGEAPVINLTLSGKGPEKGKAFEQKLPAASDSGIWGYVPLKDVPGANTLVYRVTKL